MSPIDRTPKTDPAAWNALRLETLTRSSYAIINRPIEAAQETQYTETFFSLAIFQPMRKPFEFHTTLELEYALFFRRTLNE
jgi:hypothetical protein